MSIVSDRSVAYSGQEKRQLLARILEKKAQRETLVAPLSYGQKALYFLYRSVPDSAAYHVAFTARVRSPVDVAALERAVQALLERHPLLRAIIKLEAGELVQEIPAKSRVSVEIVDAAGLSDEALQAQVIAAYRRPFDLEHGPLLRVHLFTRSATDHVLLLTVHHIVYDGWSLWINQDELGMLYRAEVEGTKAILPRIEKSYFDYVRWQAEMLQGLQGEQLWTFWQNQLQGSLPLVNLPTDRPRPPVQTYNGATAVFKLGRDLTHQLKQLAQQQGVTPYMLLLAAFQVLLHRYSGQDEILVGSPTAGRGQAEYAQVVGYFVNTLVLRADLSSNPSFAEFLAQVQETVLGAIEHQDYPFPLLVEQLQPKRDPSYSPIVQVSFVYQKPQRHGGMLDLLGMQDSGKRLRWGGLDLEYYAMAQQEGQFDLELEMLETGGAFYGSFKYNKDLFEQATIDRMVSHFETLLQGIAARPEERVGCLPLLTVTEAQQLLSWANRRGDTHRCEYEGALHTLFEAQVEARPHAIALTCEEHCLTYRELNVRANKLAHHLRRLGVGPEVLVGLYLERSPDLIVGILGILKADGAYLPLDPAYPRERLAFMLADSAAPVIVTQTDRVSALPETTAKLVRIDRDWEVIAKEGDDNPKIDVTQANLAYVIYTSGSTGNLKECRSRTSTSLAYSPRHMAGTGSMSTMSGPCSTHSPSTFRFGRFGER